MVKWSHANDVRVAGVDVSERARAVVWAVAGVCGIVTAGLVAVVLVADLDTADRLASVVGSVLGAAGLGVSVFAVSRASAGLVSGARSVQAGGSIGLAVTGDNNEVSSQADRSAPVAEAQASAPVALPGERGVAVGGSVEQAFTGDGNRQS